MHISQEEMRALVIPCIHHVHLEDKVKGAIKY